MKIIAIKANDGFYISENTASWNTIRLGDKIINGDKPKETFKKNWFFVKDEVLRVEETVPQAPKNKRYELIDKKSFPNQTKTFKRSDVVIEESCYENDYQIIFTEDFNKIRSLYEYKEDEQPNKLEEIEFSFDIIGEANPVEPNGMSFPVYRTSYQHKGKIKIENRDIIHNLFDQMTTPEILLHEKPCKLTSKKTYDIIRVHIQDNINPKHAEITSDYAFCFTVMKKISLSEKIGYTVDTNNNLFSKRKRKPKYEKRYKSDRKVQVFEMTHDQENYKDYTPIVPFEGENENDLINNINKYLKTLMERINKPLKECQHCSGRGVVEDVS